MLFCFQVKSPCNRGR